MIGWCSYDNKECRRDGDCEDCERNKCRDCQGFSCDWCVYRTMRAALRAVKEIRKMQDLGQAQPERKNGKWIKTGQSFVFPEKFRNYSCSECGYDIDKIKFNFCPNCGADMRGEE